MEALKDHPYSEIRALLCKILIHYPQQRESLISLTQDPQRPVRVAAYLALGKLCSYLEDHSTITWLVSLRLGAEDQDPQVRAIAIWALILYSPQEGLDKWKVLWKESSLQHKQAFMGMLGTLGPYNHQLLVKILHEETDPFLRVNAAWSLIGQRVSNKLAHEALWAFLDSYSSSIMWVDRGTFPLLAPSEIAYRSDIPNYPELIDQITRLELIEALAYVDSPRAEQALKKFFESKRWELVGLASKLLLSHKHPYTIELMEKLDHDPNPKVRLQAAIARGVLGKDPAVISELHTAFTTCDHRTQQSIIEALAMIKSKESVPFLVNQWITNPSLIIKTLAAYALIACLNG